MLISTKILKEITTNCSLATLKQKDLPNSNILINFKENTIEAIGSNQTATIIETREIPSTQEVSILIDPNKLLNILKEIKDENIEIETDGKILSIKAGNFKTKIKVQQTEAFEVLNDENSEEITQIEPEKLKKLIKETIYCPDKNDISREYTGIFFELEKDKIKATATDHYRLINVSTPNQNQTEITFILENNGAQILNRINLNSKIKLLKSQNMVVFKTDTTKVISKTISGNFPDYNQILLKEDTSNVVEFDTVQLKDTIKRVSTLSQNREIIIDIQLNDSKTIIKSNNNEGEEAEDIVELKNIKAEENLIIKVDSKFVLDFLPQITSQNLLFLYRSSEEPIMFKTDEDHYSYNYIMTPIIE
ncbi:DNA polymerase III subunit beta [Hippea jasoniae]|uniref:DNA polymerase III subunit beta n=1 Tax=Hippea jasoniae TaxID=944479 RepID=UPI0005510624|nr:DNA polymerase III subunit beta [Hippea jasoniae]